jgi:hypothetical protein
MGLGAFYDSVSTNMQSAAADWELFQIVSGKNA